MFQGQPLIGLTTLLLAVGLGLLWYKDWFKLDKCADALNKVETKMAAIGVTAE